MYTDVKTILDDASRNNYGVLAASAINLELARGLIAAADELQSPLIILMGQMQMTKHARADVMVPLIRTLAEETNGSGGPDSGPRKGLGGHYTCIQKRIFLHHD